jgi:hypothetical protein
MALVSPRRASSRSEYVPSCFSEVMPRIAPGMNEATSRTRCGSTLRSAKAFWQVACHPWPPERRAQVLDGPGIPRRQTLIESFDDAGHPLAQAGAGVGSRHVVRPALGGVVKYGGPEPVGVAELVLHRTPGSTDLLGDSVGRDCAGVP